MLPFTSIDFFLLLLGMLVLTFIGKAWLSMWLPYKYMLLVVSVIYLTLFFPALYQLVAYLFYSYLIYYLFEYRFKIPNKLIGAIMLVAPMVLVKAALLNNLLAFAGLSYITFRVVQLYVDNDSHQKPIALIDYIVFLIFPATLLIGPIDRYNRFKDDLTRGYNNLNSDNVIDGWQVMLYGIVQKYILSEFVNRYWLTFTDEHSKNLLDMLNNMYAYSIYLYFDFAGYSSLAIGLGKMFGINVPENFNNPFFALNPQDFWRKWHITLGDWLKDYIFRPYYKWVSSKKTLKPYPLLKQNSGLFITFLVMGLWNGFRNYLIVSGCIFGIYSVVHNTYVYYSMKNKRDIFFGNLSPLIIKIISIIIMFNLCCFALYVFSGRFPYIK